MKRILAAIFIALLLPLAAHAYTLVLKDGRRMEVRGEYRIVNDIAVFTLPEGNRFSVSLEKINIAETELANGVDQGDFVKNAVAPPKAGDQKASNSKTDEDENPIQVSSRSGQRLTNSDFERYRVRREEMARDVQRRKAAAKGTSEEEPSPATVQAAKDEEIAAKRREFEKSKEDYWRGRSRALLTKMRIEEEQIITVSAQLEENRRSALNQSPSVSIYSPPPRYVYPGIIIGGIPIGIGGGRTTGGGSTVIVNQNPGQQRGLTLQERLTELQLQHQETLIQYEELLEEGRKAGALPGWLR